MPHCRQWCCHAPDVLQWYRTLGLDLIEGLWHDRELRRLALHPARLAAWARWVSPTESLETASVRQWRNPNAARLQCACRELLPQKSRHRAAITSDGWLRTGDKGRIDAQNAQLTGRVKDIFKTARGKLAPPHRRPACAAPRHRSLRRQRANPGTAIGAVMLSADATRAPGTAGPRRCRNPLLAHLKQVNAGLEPHEAGASWWWLPRPGPGERFVTPKGQAQPSTTPTPAASNLGSKRPAGGVRMGRS